MQQLSPYDDLVSSKDFHHEGVTVPKGTSGWIVGVHLAEQKVDAIFTSLWPNSALNGMPLSLFDQWTTDDTAGALLSMLESAEELLGTEEDSKRQDIDRAFEWSDSGK